MPIAFSFHEDEETLSRREEALEKQRKTTVDVGLTSKASGRSLFLMAIHAHGAPVMRIPPRPVVQPALQKAETREAMGKELLAACEAAQAGDASGVTAAFEAAGRAGADGIRAYIDSGALTPNSPVTVSGGWIFNRVARVGVPVKGKGRNTPLKDTEQLYNDFSYEVKES